MGKIQWAAFILGCSTAISFGITAKTGVDADPFGLAALILAPIVRLLGMDASYLINFFVILGLLSLTFDLLAIVFSGRWGILAAVLGAFGWLALFIVSDLLLGILVCVFLNILGVVCCHMSDMDQF